MKSITVLTVLAASALAHAQESLERAAAELARKLAREGAAAGVAEIAQTEAGRRALEEALRECVAWKVRPYEYDPLSHFEHFLFARDDDGTLRPRPERKEDLAAIKRALDRAQASFEEFNRRADAFAVRLVDVTDIDKRIKAAWQNERFRWAIYGGVATTGDGADAVADILDGALRPDASGKFAVREDRAEALNALLDEATHRLTRGQDSERAYLAFVERLRDDEAKRALGSEFARAFVCARVGRFVSDEDGDPLNTLLVRYGLVDGEAAALGNLRKDVDHARKLLSLMKPRLDEISRSLEEGGAVVQKRVKSALADDVCQAALVEHALACQIEGGDPVEQYFEGLLGDSFEIRGNGLGVKASWFGEEGRAPSAEDVDRIVRATIEAAGERRRPYLDMAERCAEGSAAELFAAPQASPVLERRVQHVRERLVSDVLDGASDVFARRYLTKAGDAYQWRADRLGKADAIVGRAREIEKELEAAAREGD